MLTRAWRFTFTPSHGSARRPDALACRGTTRGEPLSAHRRARRIRCGSDQCGWAASVKSSMATLFGAVATWVTSGSARRVLRADGCAGDVTSLKAGIGVKVGRRRVGPEYAYYELFADPSMLAAQFLRDVSARHPHPAPCPEGNPRPGPGGTTARRTRPPVRPCADASKAATMPRSSGRKTATCSWLWPADPTSPACTTGGKPTDRK